jgi:hypothetical protein
LHARLLDDETRTPWHDRTRVELFPVSTYGA